jgi:hypothetical protein
MKKLFWILLLIPSLCWPATGDLETIGGKVDTAITSIAGKAGTAIATICGKNYTDGDGCAASYFEDAFASNDYSAWTGETDTGGLITAASGASVYSFSATTAAYSYKTLASATTESYMQLTVSASDISLGGSGKNFYLLSARDASDEASLQLQWSTNAGGDIDDLLIRYNIDAKTMATADTDNTVVWADGTTYTIKIYSKISSDVDTSNGIIRVWVNGNLILEKTDCDYYTYADLKTVRLGQIATSTVTNTAGGITVTFDNFEWRADDCF